MECNQGYNRFSTNRDKHITLEEYINSVGWNGKCLHIVGSQEDDYFGSTMIFHITIPTGIALKFFGKARLFDAVLVNNNGEVRISV